MIPGSDKSEQFLQLYDRFFSPLRDKPVHLLELGIATGASLLYWAEYFPNGTIVGLDWNPPALMHPRVRCVKADQADVMALDTCGESFDIVIDDCSHIASATQISFTYLFPKVVSGGIYAIEDWGTGYWNDWPDGSRFTPGHHVGMVGIVKDLVDRVAINDITRGSFYGHSDRKSDIDSLTIINGLAVVVKS